MRRTKEKKSGKLIALLIAIIMVSSVLGYVILDSNTSSELEYNGYEFSRDNNGFTTDINGIAVKFNFFPTDVQHISFEPDESTMLKNAAGIRITSDIGDPLQRAISLLEFEIENNFIRLNKMMILNKMAVHGFTEENENLPFITCNDSDKENPVIYITKGSSTKVESEGSCITITAKTEYDVIKVKDALLYRILGIIE